MSNETCSHQIQTYISHFFILHWHDRIQHANQKLNAFRAIISPAIQERHSKDLLISANDSHCELLTYIFNQCPSSSQLISKLSSYLSETDSIERLTTDEDFKKQFSSMLLLHGSLIRIITTLLNEFADSLTNKVNELTLMGKSDTQAWQQARREHQFQTHTEPHEHSTLTQYAATHAPSKPTSMLYEETQFSINEDGNQADNEYLDTDEKDIVSYSALGFHD